jgi:hypothetical protein
MKAKIKNLPSFEAWEGACGTSVTSFADFVCNSTNNVTKSVPRLEENLQTVDAGDADIADGAHFARAEELDRSRTGIEIVLERYYIRVMEKRTIRLENDQIDRVGPEHHGLCGGEMNGLHYSAIF